ncbi:MAG TPA: hypothetical protein VHE09_03110 [Rhizomicrobium sp.]|nr:hypothetical protein [Rhizomicrobium sp.]
MKTVVGIFAFAAVAVLTATASVAQDSKTTVIVPPLVKTTVDSSPQSIADNEMVCHKPRPMIGTRFPGPRICKTKRQWDAEMYEEQHNIAKSQIRGCLNNGTCPQ